MTDLPQVQRGRAQVLYKYLPGAVFSLGDSAWIVRSLKVSTQELTEGPKLGYVLDRIRSRLHYWQNTGEPIGDALRFYPPCDDHQFEMGIPESVLYKIFPLSFVCDKCRHFESFQSEDELIKDRGSGKCSVCSKGRMHQTNILQVHECGDVAGLEPPRCPSCGRDDRIVLDTKGRRRFADADWRCSRCGNRRVPGALSKICRCQKKISDRSEADSTGADKNPPRRMRASVHTASSNFYVHTLTMVNLKSQAGTKWLKDEGVRYAMVARYAGLADPMLKTEEMMQSAFSSGDVLLTSEEERMIESMPNEEHKKKMREMLEDAARERASPHQKSVLAAVDSCRERLERIDGAISEDAGIEIIEYEMGMEVAKPAESLHKMVERSREHEWWDIAAQQQEALESLEALGIAECRLLQEFPLVTAAYGYTRAKSEPPALMRAFPKHNVTQKHPLYVLPVNTEAVLFRIEPRRVLEWLGTRGVPGLPPPSSDDVDLRLWFASKYEGPEVFGELDPSQEPLRHAVTALLHTMSHVLMKSASIHAGLDFTSLKEYLFPRALSFVIFHNTQVENSIGSLYTLYEQRLHTWLESAREANDCIYDPVCRKEFGSACHACAHAPEFACQFFNRHLDRKVLFGGEGTAESGFWL